MQFDALFDSDGIFTQTQHYLLHRISPAEQPFYQALAQAETPDFLKDSGAVSTPNWEDLLSDTHLTCSILEKESEAFFGFCQLQWIFSPTPELGIDLLPEYRKKGVAAEVLPAFLSHVKSLLPVSHFYAKIKENNRPSQALAEKIGGVCVGKKSLLPADFPDELFAFAKTEFPNLFYLEYQFYTEKE